MSQNIKIGNNTLNGVDTIQVPLASDVTQYATFTEGVSSPIVTTWVRKIYVEMFKNSSAANSLSVTLATSGNISTHGDTDIFIDINGNYVDINNVYIRGFNRSTPATQLFKYKIVDYSSKVLFSATNTQTLQGTIDFVDANDNQLFFRPFSTLGQDEDAYIKLSTSSSSTGQWKCEFYCEIVGITALPEINYRGQVLTRKDEYDVQNAASGTSYVSNSQISYNIYTYWED